MKGTFSALTVKPKELQPSVYILRLPHVGCERPKIVLQSIIGYSYIRKSSVNEDDTEYFSK